jgi:hydrogenase nickel insertion protein HypA
MHELGMASQMLADVLKRVQGAKLKKITLGIGPMSGVSKESLRFCMDVALEERNMKDVQVEACVLPLIYVCRCGHEYRPAKPWEPCPFCGRLEREMKGGRDCNVESVEIES